MNSKRSPAFKLAILAARGRDDEATAARLLPAAARPPRRVGYSGELEQALRSLHEPEIIDAKREAAQRVLDTVPNDGGRFELTEDDAQAWAAAVNDVRLALGTMLDVGPEGPPGAVRPSDGGAFRRLSMADGAAGVPGARAHGQAVMSACAKNRRTMSAITDVGGIRVGHHHRIDPDVTLGAGWASGTTVVLTPPGPSAPSTAAAARPAHGRPTCSTPSTRCVTSTRWCSPAAARTGSPPPTA